MKTAINSIVIFVALLLVVGVSDRPLSAQEATALRVGKKGEFHIGSSFRVGDVVLRPGMYQVRHAMSDGEHVVIFKEMDMAGRGGQAKWVVKEVTRVKCRVEPLGGKSKGTQIRLRTNPQGEAEIAEVLITGENVIHKF